MSNFLWDGRSHCFYSIFFGQFSSCEKTTYDRSKGCWLSSLFFLGLMNLPLLPYLFPCALFESQLSFGLHHSVKANISAMLRYLNVNYLLLVRSRLSFSSLLLSHLIMHKTVNQILLFNTF